MTPGAVQARGAPLEALLEAQLGPPPGDVVSAARGLYRFPRGRRGSVLRGLLPSGAKRTGRWVRGGYDWLWEWSRWYVSLWERGPCS
jgi:hypothetical protein